VGQSARSAMPRLLNMVNLLASLSSLRGLELSVELTLICTSGRTYRSDKFARFDKRTCQSILRMMILTLQVPPISPQLFNTSSEKFMLQRRKHITELTIMFIALSVGAQGKSLRITTRLGDSSTVAE
jgi:hypothetical protein